MTARCSGASRRGASRRSHAEAPPPGATSAPTRCNRSPTCPARVAGHGGSRRPRAPAIWVVDCANHTASMSSCRPTTPPTPGSATRRRGLQARWAAPTTGERSERGRGQQMPVRSTTSWPSGSIWCCEVPRPPRRGSAIATATSEAARESTACSSGSASTILHRSPTRWSATPSGLGEPSSAEGCSSTCPVDPGATVATGAAVEVSAHSASWAPVDRVLLFDNGVAVERVDGTTARLVLSPSSDALFTMVAEGDAPPQPIDFDAPWAMSNGIYVDVDGDGWSPPLSPMSFE